MSITAQESSFEELAENIYPATLSAWEETAGGQYGPGVKIIWTLHGLEKSNGDPQDKWQFVTQKLTPKSTLWAICKTLGEMPVLGRSYEVDEVMDPLVGTQANLVIKHEDTPNGPRARVTEVMALNGSAPQVAARSAPGAAPRAVANKDVCKVTGCGVEATKYTGGGSPLCDAHTAEDL